MKTCLILILTLSITPSLYPVNQNINDSIRARETYVSGLALARKGDYSNAIDVFKISLFHREKYFTKDSREYGIVQNALGICYRNLGNLDKAIEHFLLAEKAYNSNKTENLLSIAGLYNNIGILYKNKLNYTTSLDYLFKSLEIYSNDEETSDADIADVYYNIAENYFNQKNHKKALEIAEKYFHLAYDDTKLYYLGLQAGSLKQMNRNDEAYKAYQKVLEYTIRSNVGNEANVILEYLNFASFLISIKKFEEALQNLKLAKIKIEENHLTEGLIYHGFQRTLGNYYEYLKVESNDIENFRVQKSANLKKAIEHYKLASEALQMKPEEITNFTAENTLSLTHSLNSLKLIADAYAQIADIYLNAESSKTIFSLKEALKHYDITSRTIQQARQSMYSDEDKIVLAELEEATFFKMIDAAYKAYRLDSNPEVLEFAFTSAERMKASSVFDRLSDQFAKENNLVPDSLTDLERALNYQITTQNEILFNLQNKDNQDAAAIAKTDSLLFQLKKQREELNKHFELNFPEYYEMKYANSMLGTDDVQQNLKSNEVLIEYVLNETDSIPEVYAFLISHDHSGLYKLNTDSSFIPALEETFRFLSNPAYLFTRNESSVNYCISANYLYQVLLQPFDKYIRDKKITIVPDGKLNYLPFDALLTSLPDTSGLISFNTLPYVIHDYTINYSYSANLLFKFKKTERKAQKRLLAFAPEYNTDTVRFDNESLVLIPLPGVQREVALIADAVKAQLYRGSRASEKNFREQSGDHDILHLAMHAFINDSLPAFSRFAFAQNQDTLPQNDGWLNTADIYNLHLKARLTVLSACNTGRGNLRKGEGVMSLARGFLYAGCPSIIMSMWEVEDYAGTEIMHSFYQTLKKGRSTDYALRQAKLEYLKNANPRLAHPHYWLGYVSIGSTNPLFRSYDFYFFGLLILALTGITADQIIRFRKTGKRRYRK